MKDELKDWQIANLMFGKNSRIECKLVSELRKHGIIEKIDNEYSIIKDSRLTSDCGWLIPNICLKD